MYIPQIKERHSLVDLAKYGTRSRKNIHSDILIGEHPPYPIFREGDILDGNATFNLIQCAYDQGKVYNKLSSKIDELADSTNHSIIDLQESDYEINKSIEELKKGNTDAVIELREDVDRLSEDINQCSSNLQQLSDKHEEDVQDLRDYIDTEIERTTIRLVYDDLEENLIIIK